MTEQAEKSFLKKHWSNILLVGFIVLMIFPQTRMPVQSTLQRIIAFAPSTTDKGERLTDYNWPLEDLTGREISFSEAQGNVVVLNFWATWCPPCVAEMPYFQDLYNQYGDRVRFYFVTDETPEKVTAFIEKRGYNLPVQIMRYAAPEILQSKALPTTFVLGKNGEIHIHKKGSAKWNSSKVKSLLDRLLTE